MNGYAMRSTLEQMVAETNAIREGRCTRLAFNRFRERRHSGMTQQQPWSALLREAKSRRWEPKL